MAYLFQAGAMAVSGNITLQPDYSLLAEKDSVSDIGETGTRFSNIYVDNYYGDASAMTGLSAQIDVTSSTFDNDFKLAFVQDLGTDKKLAGSDFIFANPTSTAFGGWKTLQVSSSLSGATIIGDGLLAVMQEDDKGDILVATGEEISFFDEAVFSDDGTLETSGDVICNDVQAEGNISGSGTLIADGNATLNGNVGVGGTISGNGSGISNVPIALGGPDGGNWIQPMMLAASGSRDAETTTGLFAREGVGWNNASSTFSSPGDIFCSGNYTGGGSGLTNVPIALTGPDGADHVQPMMIAASGSRDNGTTTGLFALEGLGWNNANSTFIVPGSADFDGAVEATSVTIGGTLTLDQGSSQTIDLTAQPTVIQMAEDTSGNNGALLFMTGASGDFMVFDTLYDWVAIKQNFSASCDKVFLGNSTSATVSIIGKVSFGSGLRYSSIAVKTTNTTLDDTNSYIVCSGSAHTITLPGSPKNGYTYFVKRSSLMTGAAGDNDITIAGAGKNVDGTSQILLETPGAAVSLVYDGTSDQWNVF